MFKKHPDSNQLELLDRVVKYANDFLTSSSEDFHFLLDSRGHQHFFTLIVCFSTKENLLSSQFSQPQLAYTGKKQNSELNLRVFGGTQNTDWSYAM